MVIVETDTQYTQFLEDIQDGVLFAVPTYSDIHKSNSSETDLIPLIISSDSATVIKTLVLFTIYVHLWINL